MDGYVVLLDKIVELVDKYNVMVMIDECYLVGVVGEIGCGVIELYDLMGKVEIIIGILGKVFGGVIGGFIMGKKEIIELLC